MERVTSTTTTWREISPNCPRCGSSHTKFCYYNNYSFTQPRFFCKSCRRYWTKGGSLRNVPVGGGCRKTQRATKSTSSPRAPPPTPYPYGSMSTATARCPLLAGSSGPTIDLAVVYANFLNPSPKDAPIDEVRLKPVSVPDQGVRLVESPSFSAASPLLPPLPDGAGASHDVSWHAPVIRDNNGNSQDFELGVEPLQFSTLFMGDWGPLEFTGFGASSSSTKP